MKYSKNLMHQCKIVGKPAERSVFCEDFSEDEFLFFGGFGLRFQSSRPDFNPNALFKEQLKSVKVEELWEELAAGVAVQPGSRALGVGLGPFSRGPKDLAYWGPVVGILKKSMSSW